MSESVTSRYGLTFHPFRPDVPVEALTSSIELDSFLFHVEQQMADGGFASIMGDPGTGKSAALRLLQHRLSKHKDVKVGVLTRPQGNNADFYRELGHMFGVSLTPHNRWAGSRVLREAWLSHIDQSRQRPVLIIDEAQEMQPSVLCELRLLSSMNLDARALLTVVIAGDERLKARFRSPDLLPVASRIRARLHLGYTEHQHLERCIDNLLQYAGRPDLMTDDVRRALAQHAHGNLRSMMTMADSLLAHAFQHDLATIDEGVFFDVFKPRKKPAA